MDSKQIYGTPTGCTFSYADVPHASSTENAVTAAYAGAGHAPWANLSNLSSEKQQND